MSLGEFMKTLIMLSAFPACGKSTWANAYKKEHPNTFILNSDYIRMEITNGDYQDHSRQKEVWETFERRIHEYAEKDNVTVILDALNDVNEVRLKYLSTTPEYDKKVLVMFPNSSKERAVYFNNLREEEVRVPAPILENLINKFEEPNEEVFSLVNEIRYIYW